MATAESDPPTPAALVDRLATAIEGLTERLTSIEHPVPMHVVGATVGDLAPRSPAVVAQHARTAQDAYEQHDTTAWADTLPVLAQDLEARGLTIAKLVLPPDRACCIEATLAHRQDIGVTVRLSPTPRPAANEPFVLKVALRQHKILIAPHTTTHARLLATLDAFLAGMRAEATSPLLEASVLDDIIKYSADTWGVTLTRRTPMIIEAITPAWRLELQLIDRAAPAPFRMQIVSIDDPRLVLHHAPSLNEAMLLLACFMRLVGACDLPQPKRRRRAPTDRPA